MQVHSPVFTEDPFSAALAARVSPPDFLTVGPGFCPGAQKKWNLMFDEVMPHFGVRNTMCDGHVKSYIHGNLS